MPSSTNSGNIGLGTQLGYSATQSGYTHIADLKDIGGTEPKFEEYDRTAYSDTVIQTAAGLLNGGEQKNTVMYNASNSATLNTLKQTKAIKYWQVLFPDTSGYWYQGWIQSLGTEQPMKEGIKNTITIRLTSDVTFFAAGAGT